MKVLLDHCVPKGFGGLLTGHVVHTASFMKWDGLKNGELLQAAAPEYSVLVTVDRNLRFQQHVGELPLAVFALACVSNRLEDLAPLAPAVLKLLAAGPQKQVYTIGG